MAYTSELGVDAEQDIPLSRNCDSEALLEFARAEMGDAYRPFAEARRDPPQLGETGKQSGSQRAAQMMASLSPIDTRAARKPSSPGRRGEIDSQFTTPFLARIGQEIGSLRLGNEKPAIEQRSIDLDGQNAGEMFVATPGKPKLFDAFGIVAGLSRVST